jgi:thiosulfate dehydrogenase [quinone] large subunit
MAPIWAIIRIYLGYQWLMSGLSKLSNPAWVGDGSGGAVAGFINGALAKTGGEHPDVSGWYASFLQQAALPNARVFAYVVTFGELAVGIALILGLLTGLAAFFGGFMNLSYLLAGSVSINPVLFILATWVVLAWRVAGYWGLDRWVLPLLGVHPRPQLAFGTAERQAPLRVPSLADE